MAAPPIEHMTERNLVGLCYLDVVEVEDVASVGDELQGNVADTVVLKAGKAWSRVYLESGGEFAERWPMVGGVQHSAATIAGDIAKDRLALMPLLWKMKGRRYLVLFTNQNGDQLLMGRLETPALAKVVSRTTGDKENLERDRNGYSILFSLNRRLPVPFYGGTAPEPPAPPGTCPTLCEQMDAAFAIPPAGGGGDPVLTMALDLTGSGPLPVTGTLNGRDWYTNSAWGTFVNYAEAYWTGSAWYVTDGNSVWTSTDDVASPDLITNWTGDAPYPVLTMEGGGEPVDVGAQQIVNCWDEEQLERVQALVCTPATNGRAMTTDGETPVITVPPGTDVPLPQSVILIKNASNADAEIAASNTLFSGGTLKATTRIPRREIFNDADAGLGLFISAADLIADTVPQVPAVVVGDPIIYAFDRSLWSGQVTSYRAGDEGAMFSDGFFDHVFTVGQNSVIQRLVNHNTLQFANVHGNTNRFTNRSGGTPSGSGNRFLRDHYTGVEYYLQSWSAGNWNDAIDAGVATNAALSETGWYSVPVRMMGILNEYSAASVWTESPFNASTPRTIWSSSTNVTTSLAWGVNTAAQGFAIPAKTTTINMLIGIYCRKFF